MNVPTFTLFLVAFNIYVILGFAGIKDKIKGAYDTACNKASDACQKFIPKYKEECPSE